VHRREDPAPELPSALDPELERYVGRFGRPGDRGVVAVERGEDAGAAWYRVFTAEAPGYGYVDERIPEL
jgi:hypothetical protein